MLHVDLDYKFNYSFAAIGLQYQSASDKFCDAIKRGGCESPVAIDLSQDYAMILSQTSGVLCCDLRPTSRKHNIIQKSECHFSIIGLL